MLQDLRIVHRLKPAVFGDVPGTRVFATCLRSLAFGEVPALPGDEVYSGEAAYRFLLEVACGLKSPIVGETEVFGQFKTFCQQWVKLEPKRAPLIQRLLSDTKSIRSEHLLNMGVQSYGSWVRSRLRDQRVHILGSGQLVSEIYPYLAKQNRDVTLHVRNLARGPEAPKRLLESQAFDSGALIIAAPMTATEIREWLNGKTPTQIIDLRDTSTDDALNLSSETSKLRCIFKEIEKTKAVLAPRLETIRAEIRDRAVKAAQQSQIRPQGWDDLCA